MDKKSSTYMTLGTTLGMFIALVISLIILFNAEQYTWFVPVAFIIFAIGFRCIGYGLDRFLDRRNEK